MVENDPDNESRLNLTINRKPIADWFKEEWHRLRYGIRLPQQQEKKKTTDSNFNRNDIKHSCKNGYWSVYFISVVI